MVSAPRRLFEEVLWREFNELHADLSRLFDQTTDRLIRQKRSIRTPATRKLLP